MKALVIYDSLFGNTEKIAKEIGKVLGNDASVLHVKKVNPKDVKNLSILVVGSPTHGGRPTPEISKFIEMIPSSNLKNLRVAAFDTRISIQEQAKWLKIIMNIINYAAPKISSCFTKKGANLISPPEGFIVEDKEGPLRKGELERSRKWAQKFASS